MAKNYSAKQRKIRASVVGADEIILSLRAMENGASKALMKAAKEGGNIAFSSAKKNCPTDTGALKESIKMTEGKATKEKATVKIDYDKKLYYGVFVELGTKKNAAHPFMRKAVDDNENEITKDVVKEISDAVGRKI